MNQYVDQEKERVEQGFLDQGMECDDVVDNTIILALFKSAKHYAKINTHWERKEGDGRDPDCKNLVLRVFEGPISALAITIYAPAAVPGIIITISLGMKTLRNSADCMSTELTYTQLM